MAFSVRFGRVLKGRTAFMNGQDDLSNVGLSFFAPLNDLGAGVVNLTPSRGIGSPTFTRASTATTILSNGLIGTVASGTARSCYSPAGVYLGYLAEEQRTNKVLQSENFGTTWSALGTPTRTAGAKTCGVVSLDLLSDADAGTSDGYQQVVTFTGDGTKAVSFFFAQGTSTSSRFDINDTTAVAIRVLCTITWSVGVPTVTVTTGTLLGVDTLGNGVFRARVLTGAITAANNNTIRVYPANTAAGDATLTGNAYFGGVQAEDAAFATSYIPTTTATVTRNADVLSYPYSGNVVGSVGTVYCEGAKFGATTANSMIVAPDTGGYWINDNGSPNSKTVSFDGTNVASVSTGSSALGSVTKRAVVYAGSSMTDYQGGTSGSPQTFAGTWVGTTSIGIGHAGGGGQFNGAVKNVRIWSRALADLELIQLTR